MYNCNEIEIKEKIIIIKIPEILIFIMEIYQFKSYSVKQQNQIYKLI